MKITTKQKQQIKKIAEKYHLRFIIIHGSYARGEEREGSDLDVAVYENERIDYSKLFEMRRDFSTIFGDNEDRELDLKTLYDKDPLFVYQVVRDSQLIYGKKYDYCFFEAATIRNYFFNSKIFKLEDILIKKALQNL